MKPRLVFDYICYLLVRAAILPISIMPISWIHNLGRALGLLLFHALPGFRKRTLSNLSLAHSIVRDEKHLFELAKQSFQNLCITALEYGKLPFIRDINKLVECVNPEKAQAIIKGGKGLLFFVGHQANWELLFLKGTSLMPGVAIGRPIKNRFLYAFVVRMRERFGGKLFEPRQGLKEGLRALKQGKFLGIVGDQAFPGGSYASPFLGVNAYTSTAPALLAYKTNSPIISASIWREKNKYKMHFSDPIWPDKSKPLELEAPRMMDECLSILESSIRKYPSQWLWQHNRWKQERADITYYRYRKNPILVIVPPGQSKRYIPLLLLLQKIYPKAFLTLLSQENPLLPGWSYKPYSTSKDLFIKDYRFQLVFNFSNETKLKRHFLSLSASTVIDHKTLARFAKQHGLDPTNKEQLLAKLLTRKGKVEVNDAHE